MAKTVVGLFQNLSEAENVVSELVEQGVAREEISILGRDESADVREAVSDRSAATGGAGTGAGAGAAIGGSFGVVAGLAALMIPGIGPIIAVGPIVAGLAGGGIGATAGGLIGALTKAGVSESDAQYYEDAVRRGGVLVLVQCPDVDTADRVTDLMTRHGSSGITERNGPAIPATESGSIRIEGTREVKGGGPRSEATRTTRREKPDELYGEAAFRAHFDSRYRGRGYYYEQVAPAYRFGNSLAQDRRFLDKDWNQIEREARKDWENRYGGEWNVFRDAVRFAYQRTYDRIHAH